MTTAFITPELITWARNRARLTQAQLAKRATVSETALSAWEVGSGHPTLLQAERLARKLYVPFGYLFLSAAPTLELSLPDLRTVQGEPIAEPSPEFYDVLSDAMRKQEWYIRYLDDEGAAPLPYVGRFSMDTPVEEVASDIHDTLGISQEIRPQAANWEDFLQRLMSKAEQIGVLVLRNSVVGNNTHRHLKTEEFRGFVISDVRAPLIFLNGSDARSAQIFTLVHELAHLWFGESGVSNPDYEAPPHEREHPIETLCDNVAAETLVPARVFLSGWHENRSIEQNLDFLTRYFRVSRVVTLRRAYVLNKVSRAEFFDYYFHGIGNKRPVKLGGGDFNRNLLVRNSHTFATALVGAVFTGYASEREAARLLNVQIPAFDRFSKWLAEGA